jgi:hypothetical protein
MFPEKLLIDPGFIIEALELGGRRQLAEVAVTLLIFGQQD